MEKFTPCIAFGFVSKIQLFVDYSNSYLQQIKPGDNIFEQLTENFNEHGIYLFHTSSDLILCCMSWMFLNDSKPIVIDQILKYDYYQHKKLSYILDNMSFDPYHKSDKKVATRNHYDPIYQKLKFLYASVDQNNVSGIRSYIPNRVLNLHQEALVLVGKTKDDI